MLDCTVNTTGDGAQMTSWRTRRDMVHKVLLGEHDGRWCTNEFLASQKQSVRSTAVSVPLILLPAKRLVHERSLLPAPSYKHTCCTPLSLTRRLGPGCSPPSVWSGEGPARRAARQCVVWRRGVDAGKQQLLFNDTAASRGMAYSPFPPNSPLSFGE